MVSEDSNPVGAVFPPIHRRRKLSDCFQSLWSEVIVGSHPLHTLCELFKVFPFCGLQRMLLEKRDDDLEQFVALAHDIAVQGFLMVIRASVDDKRADAEEVLQLLQGVEAACALRHRELMEHLYSSFVALAEVSIGLIEKTDRETAFAVYKTDDPSDKD